MYESGMTQAEVAEHFGVKQKTIWKLFKQAQYQSRIPINKKNIKTGDQKAENNGNWKGGVTITGNGYIMVRCPDHPRAKEMGNYVYQHILVMERYLGRYLEWYGLGHKDNEVVHHINHNKQDNRIENLQLMKHSQHIKLHSDENKVKWSKAVRRIDTGEIYPSAAEASRALGMTARAVSRAINKKTKAGGTYWEYV
ncbi:hypothetical protein GTQ43_36755 [Nostoc sp. KVJ3]|nr:hypothetical protein [Nostoc sp. KVJ3]